MELVWKEMELSSADLWCEAREEGGLRLWPHAGRNGSCLGWCGSGHENFWSDILSQQVKGFLEKSGTK